LLELTKLGYTCAREAARQIIQEQVQTGGRALPWDDRRAYTRLMLQRSVESFREFAAVARPAFADRGIPDTLCYARLIGLADARWIVRACRRYRYAPLVFLAPPWKEIYRTDGERKQDFGEAERTHAVMTEVYREQGYRILELAKVTVEARAQFIVDAVRSSA
jgi:predicted ATPase